LFVCLILFGFSAAANPFYEEGLDYGLAVLGGWNEDFSPSQPNVGLTGFNLGKPRSSRLDLSSLAKLRLLNVKLVRVQLTVEYPCAGCKNLRLRDGDLDYLASLALNAHLFNYRIVVALDVADSIRNSPDWCDRRLFEELAKFWAVLSSRLEVVYLGSEGVFYGFDILNEPDFRRCAHSSAHEYYWLSGAANIMKKIRRIDYGRRLIVEGDDWAIPSRWDMRPLLAYNNVVYSFHSYEPIEFTHSGVGARPRGFRYPQLGRSGAWSRSGLEASFRRVIEFQRRYAVEIYVGEFSCSKYSDYVSCGQFLADHIRIFDAAGFHWTYHAYEEWEGWRLPEADSCVDMGFGDLKECLLATLPFRPFSKEDFLAR
jgi:hypothetical protein